MSNAKQPPLISGLSYFTDEELASLTEAQLYERLAEIRAAQRLRRKRVRDKKRNSAALAREKSVAVGANAYMTSLKGFSKGQRLPKHFKPLINNISRLVYSDSPLFEMDNGGITRKLPERCKKRLFQVLVTLLTTCDLTTGRLGRVTKNGMNTTSHDDLMIQYSIRWGEAIPSSSWYRYIDILKQAGLYLTKDVKHKDKEGNIKSFSSYKWFSRAFMAAIGAIAEELKYSIQAARLKSEKNGYVFEWRPFRAKHQVYDNPQLFPTEPHSPSRLQ